MQLVIGVELVCLVNQIGLMCVWLSSTQWRCVSEHFMLPRCHSTDCFSKLISILNRLTVWH
jgi:hypothetical protein